MAPSRNVTLATKDVGGEPVVGVELSAPTYKFPFKVKINLPDIGGPSAGLMFALGIIDKLTPDNLTGGRFIAGTGEIDPTGQIQPIGGIQQKMAGAREAGATIFLSPASNCANTTGAVPSGLRLVKVGHAGPGCQRSAGHQEGRCRFRPASRKRTARGRRSGDGARRRARSPGPNLSALRAPAGASGPDLASLGEGSSRCLRRIGLNTRRAPAELLAGPA